METIINTINRLTSNFKPKVGVILGSGLGGFASEVDIRYTIPYSDIDGIPVSTVEGHSGELLFGYVGNTPIVVMKGRFHFYEGYSTQQATILIRVMKRLGVARLLISNAAGAINNNFRVGDVMVINNHINFLPNPLIGANDNTFGVRFPDMKHPYSLSLIDKAFEYDSALRRGVYVALTGPSYETAAEINMLRIVGGDAVGMSTAPEVIVANHCSMEVFAVSIITNDTSELKATHEEVVAVANQASLRMNKLFNYMIQLRK